MKKSRVAATLMIIAILAITGFQVYWLKNNYDREKQNLDFRTNAAFRQTILRLQATKLKLEKIFRIDSSVTSDIMFTTKRPGMSVSRPARRGEPAITVLNLVEERLRNAKGDSTARAIITSKKNDLLKEWGADSIKKIKIRFHKDSIPDPRRMQEIHVDSRTADSSGRVVTYGYGEKARWQPEEDMAFHEGEGVFMEKRLPPVPGPGDVMIRKAPEMGPEGNMVFRLLYDIDSLSVKDSVTVKEITTAYASRLKDENINISFRVNRLDSNLAPPFNAVTIGFARPTSFTLTLQDEFGYMLDKLKLPILFSLLLVGITIISFVLLYRNMLKQKRLAEVKNEFISNITHELKTPIATVGVAIEALKSFNAIDDPKRTEEYLDISQNELQRLNLLVDKVLKLSMFEKKEVELKYETVDLTDVVNEVVASMRLQIEKYRAAVSVNIEGDCTLQTDRLHLLSVVFNLLDNALKYGKNNQAIRINLEEKETTIVMAITDNGIGIAPEYKNKIFEKFFRIPHGDTHNAKGYGLGLSYVAHVVKKHKGTIAVESQPGNGAAFVITLPKQNT